MGAAAQVQQLNYASKPKEMVSTISKWSHLRQVVANEDVFVLHEDGSEFSEMLCPWGVMLLMEP